MNEDLGLVIGLLATLCGLCFGTYTVGRQQERRVYTAKFVALTQKTYYEGYADGYAVGHGNLPLIEREQSGE